MNTVGSWRNLDQFPLSRLQKLTLQSTFNSPVELLEVLERCTSLRSLTFRVTQEQAEEDDESVVQPSIVLSNLTTLVVELPLHLPPGLRRTMCSLSFPRIQNLRIITSPCQNWNAPTWHAHFIHVRTLGSHHPSYGAGLAAPYEDLSLLRSSPWVLDLLRLCAFQEIEEFVISNDLSWPGVMDFLDSDQLLGADPCGDANCSDIPGFLSHDRHFGESPHFPKLRILQIVNTRFAPEGIQAVVNDRTVASGISPLRVEIDCFLSNPSADSEYQLE
ncbi:hypothetical protein BDV98DRAFT_205059 [Pterulicium gracile]|uniref:F-box domain-containing protein n=1 Tax=Pterulicium gracile TaxID=1884261 RepID=A0A5C3Q8R3_9AGAR|nr:hypothetical protein BDV98DRAFT_205059 [Pterula gracilis]